MKRLILGVIWLSFLSAGPQLMAGSLDYVFLTGGEFGTMDLQSGSFTAIGPASATYEDMTRLPGGVCTPWIAPPGSSSSIRAPVRSAPSSEPWEMGSRARSSTEVELCSVTTGLIYIRSTRPTRMSRWSGRSGSAPALFMTPPLTATQCTCKKPMARAEPLNVYTVNTSTGAATLVGNVGYALYAMDYENGTLFGFTESGQIVSINTSTGAGTFVANQSSGDVFSAATAGSAVPEPASLILLGIGFAGVAAVRRRGK